MIRKTRQDSFPPRKDDEGLRIFHEHRLPYEEVPEVDADIGELVYFLLEWQLDVTTHRRPPRLARASIRRLHDPRAAPGDDPVSGLPEEAHLLDATVV